MFLQFLPQDISGFLHKWVAVAAAFKDARFETAGTVGNFTSGDLAEKPQTELAESIGGQCTARDQLPGREDILTCSREANLARLLAM